MRGIAKKAASAVIAIATASAAIAGQRNAAENFLVPLSLEKPAVFLYGGYLDYLKDYKYREWKDELTQAGLSPDELKANWDATIENDFTEEFFSHVFYSARGFPATPVLANLVKLVWANDAGEGVPCAISDDNEATVTDNVNSPSNIPFTVSSTYGGIELREKLSEEMRGFKETDWRRYFYFWMEDGGYWHDPATRKIWVTSWNDLRDRWDNLLGSRLDGSGKAEIRRQMKVIYDSGRLEKTGGDAWRKRLNKYYKDKALAPVLVVQNQTGGEREGEVEWRNENDEVVKSRELGKIAVNGIWSGIAAPYEGVESQGALRATLRFWIPGFKCCGTRSFAVDFKSPFDADQSKAILSGNSAWETRDTAELVITIENQQGRKCNVFFVNGKEWKQPFLERDGKFTAEVTAHTAGYIRVDDADTGKEILRGEEIDYENIHRGMKLEDTVRLPDIVRKKLEKAEDFILVGDDVDSLLSVIISRDYAVFKGDQNAYGNASDMDGCERVESVESVPVEVRCGNMDIPESLRDFAKPSLEKKGVKWNGTRFILGITNPDKDKWQKIPRQTVMVMGWKECRDMLGNHSLHDRLKILGELMKYKGAWSERIKAEVKLLQPKIRITNKTGKKLFLKLGDYGEEMEFPGSRTAEFVASAAIGIATVREDGYEAGEYADDCNKMRLPENVAVGQTEEVAITDANLRLKPDPQITMELPDDTLQGKISVKQGMDEQTIEVSGRTAEITLYAHVGIESLVLQLDGYENVDLLNASSGTVSLFSTNEKYFGVNYGVTKKWKIKSEDLRKKIIVDDEDGKGPDSGDPRLPEWSKLPKKMRNLKTKIEDANTPTGKGSAEKDIEGIADEYKPIWEQIVEYYSSQGENESNARRKAIAYVLDENEEDELVDKVLEIFSRYEYWRQ